MINANELRIGNLLINKDEVFNVISVYLSEFNNKYLVKLSNERHNNNSTEVLSYIETLKAIPITEEWLLKFGFEKGNNIDVPIHVLKKKFKLDDINSELSYSLNTKYLFLNQRNNSVFIGNLIHIHKFQNLYFALTQKELEYVGENKD